MGDGAVVALEEVLGDELLVRIGGRLRTGVVPQPVDIDAGGRDELGQVSENVGEWRGFGIRIREEKRAPGADRRRPQDDAFALEPGLALRARRRLQLAVEAVGPGVVRALQRLAGRRSGKRAKRPPGRA